MDVECPELDELVKSKENAECWVHVAEDMRNHSTHRRNLSFAFHGGGDDDGKLFLRHSRSGKLIKMDYADVFEDWYLKMGTLLNNLRNTAMSKCQSNL